MVINHRASARKPGTTLTVDAASKRLPKMNNS
jgi:hypothetical protein